MKKVFTLLLIIITAMVLFPNDILAQRRDGGGGRRGGGGGGGGRSARTSQRSPSMSRSSSGRSRQSQRSSQGSRSGGAQRSRSSAEQRPMTGQQRSARPSTGQRQGGSKGGRASRDDIRSFVHKSPREQRSDRSPVQRQGKRQDRRADRSPEQRQGKRQDRRAERSPEQRQGKRQDRRAERSPEQRQERRQGRRAERSPEQRQERRQGRRDQAKNVRHNVSHHHPGWNKWFHDDFWRGHHYHPHYPIRRAYWRNRANWTSLYAWYPWAYGGYYYYDSGYVYCPECEDSYVSVPSFNYTDEQIELSDHTSEDVTNEDDWLPLGIYALSGDDHTSPNMYLQIAINKEADIAGTLYNSTSNQTYELIGYVDSETQRVVMQVANADESPILETGLYNLTEDETSVRLHFSNGQTQDWTLVQLEDED